MPTASARSTGAINRASRAVTVDAYAIPRANVIGCAHAGRTRYQDPALSCLLRRERAAVTPTPQRCRYRDLNLLIPCRRPRRPRMRRAGQARHFSCKSPLALTRLQCGTHTASTLAAGFVFRVSRVAASMVSSLRLRKTGSSTSLSL